MNLNLIKDLDSIDYLAPIVKDSQEVSYRSISNEVALVGTNSDFSAQMTGNVRWLIYYKK